MRVLPVLLKKGIYMIKTAVAFSVLFLGFGVEEVGIQLCRISYKISKVGDRIQELAVEVKEGVAK